MHREAGHRRAPEPLPPYVPQSRRPPLAATGGLLPPWTSSQRSFGPLRADTREPSENDSRVAGAELTEPMAEDSRAPAWLDAAASMAPTPETPAEAEAETTPAGGDESAAGDASQRPEPPRDDWSELFEVETYLSPEAAADLEAYLEEGASASAAAGAVEAAPESRAGEHPSEAAAVEAAAESPSLEDVETGDLVWEPDFGDEDRFEGEARDMAVAEGLNEESFEATARDAEQPGSRADAPRLETTAPWQSPGAILEESGTSEIETAEAAGAPLDTWPGEADAWDAVAVGGEEPTASAGATSLIGLAARLEAFAAELRRDGEAALARGFGGDRLQAALAALIAGHRAASGE